jgi:sugar phosphate isomerase/epimerase
MGKMRHRYSSSISHSERRHSERGCDMTQMTRRSIVAAMASAPLLHAMAAKKSVFFGYGTYGMRTLAARRALQLIANIGYEGVELCIMPGWDTDSATISPETARTLGEVLRDRGLVAFAFIDSLGMSNDPKRRDKNLERLKRAAELADRLRVSPVLDTVLGSKSADWYRVKYAMADEVSAWAEQAKGGPLTIGIKPHAGQALDRPEKVRWILKQISKPNVRVVYDYSHMQLEGLSIEESLRPLLPYTATISVKDARGTANHPQYLLPGDGTIDYVAYFNLLKKWNYRGFVSVEVSRMIFDQAGYDPIRTAHLCYERLKPILHSAGLD